jgi:acyl-CoA synthetase (AMP-forming)/AMP-acid ligase II
LAFYLKKHGFKRVGILCPNTPAFLESIFGIAAAGAVNVGKNFRLGLLTKGRSNIFIFKLSTTVSRKKILPIFSSMEMQRSLLLTRSLCHFWRHIARSTLMSPSL